MTNRDLDYYARRAQQERESAERTEDSIAKRVHKEMAERYAARLAELAPVQRVSA
jgi:DNA-directed RNA polymerase subunit F